MVRLGKAFTVVAVDKETECGEAENEDLKARYRQVNYLINICALLCSRSDKLKLFIREYFTEIEKEVPDRPPAVEACEYEVSFIISS